jgi:hypothetical protein
MLAQFHPDRKTELRVQKLARPVPCMNSDRRRCFPIRVTAAVAPRFFKASDPSISPHSYCAPGFHERQKWNRGNQPPPVPECMRESSRRCHATRAKARSQTEGAGGRRRRSPLTMPKAEKGREEEQRERARRKSNQIRPNTMLMLWVGASLPTLMCKI